MSEGRGEQQQALVQPTYDAPRVLQHEPDDTGSANQSQRLPTAKCSVQFLESHSASNQQAIGLALGGQLKHTCMSLCFGLVEHRIADACKRSKRKNHACQNFQSFIFVTKAFEILKITRYVHPNIFHYFLRSTL